MRTRSISEVWHLPPQELRGLTRLGNVALARGSFFWEDINEHLAAMPYQLTTGNDDLTAGSLPTPSRYWTTSHDALNAADGRTHGKIWVDAWETLQRKAPNPLVTETCDIHDVNGHGMSLGFRAPMSFRRSAMSRFQSINVHSAGSGRSLETVGRSYRSVFSRKLGYDVQLDSSLERKPGPDRTTPGWSRSGGSGK